MTAARAPFGRYLDESALARVAPSIFTELRHPDRSESYRHVPTCRVLAALRAAGFEPVAASQSGGGPSDSIRGLFARHCVRLRRREESFARDGIVPEVVLRNAHDGSGGYELSAGLFRIVCLNGLVVGAGDLFRFAVRHAGGDDLVPRVLAASDRVVGSLPEVLRRVDRMRGRTLDGPRAERFASAAQRLSPSTLDFDPSRLLAPRRPEDLSYDAWTVFNVVQENLVRGGVEGADRTGSVRRTSSIRDAEREVSLNRALWDLAEVA